MFEWLSELSTGMVAVIIIVVILVIAGSVGTLVYYTTFAKPIEDAKRGATKHTHQYIESSRSRLLKFAEEYNTARAQILQYEAAQERGQGDYTKVIGGLKAQQLAVLASIKEEHGRLPEAEVPKEITKILNRVGEI